jgi:hypothetical protein
MIRNNLTPSLIKAIYRRGKFELAEPVEGLTDESQVQLLIWQVGLEQSVFGADDELQLDAWEQYGLQPPELTPQEIEARLKRLEANAGSIQLSAEQTVEIAMADWLLEENLDL